MFDIEDNWTLMELIDRRGDENFVIPMYVDINGRRYGILELDEITSFSPSFVKVGFGSSFGIFVGNAFITEHMYDFSIVRLFDNFDYDKNVLTKYIIFESGKLTEDEIEMSPMHKQMQLYIDAIINLIEKNVQQYRDNVRKHMFEDE